MALQPNKTTGKAVADVQALYFLKHVDGAEPIIMENLDSPGWFPVLSLRGSVTASQDAPSIEKINVDQFDAPIGITTEPGDFNFEVQLPSLDYADLVHWFEGDDIKKMMDENGDPITIDNRQLVGLNINGEIKSMSVLIKTRTGHSIIFSNVQVSYNFTKEDKVFEGRVSGQVLAAENPANHMIYIATEKAVFPVHGLTLNKSSLSLAVGAQESLVATIAPERASDKKVLWESSDEAVATVDESGKVSAIAAGSATIKAKAHADESIYAECALTVPQPVTGVSLNKSELTLEEEAEETLVATVAPEDAADKSVEWASSNEEVATVDENGKVSAVAAGEAIISVSTVDGCFSASCALTVTAQ